MPIHEVTEHDFASQVEKGAVLVDFSAQWCSPCRALLPILRSLAEEGVEVRTVDAELNRTLAERYGIRSFPTVIAFKDGQPGRRLIGLTTKEKLRALL